jgi:hypothetical protein
MDEAPNIVMMLKYYPAASNNKQFADRRAYYSSSTADDYMGYVDKGVLEKGTPTDFVSYVGDGEKSSGLFGKDGMLSKERKAEMRKALRATGSVIWDAVISFKEGYGQKNIRDWRDAHGLLKAQLNRFFKQAGLHPDNVEWYAGLHTNTNNSHIHLSFFEREPKFLRQKDRTPHYHNGKLRQSGIDGFKIAAENYFSDATAKIKAARKEVLSAAQNALVYSTDKTVFNNAVTERLVDIIKRLPEDGRLSYASAGMEHIRRIADDVTAFILKHDKNLNRKYLGFVKCLQDRDDTTRNYCKRNHIKNVEQHLVADKTVEDLYKRLGNYVINTARLLRDKYYKKQFVKQGSASRRIARKGFLKSLELTAWLIGKYDTECAEAFEEYLERLEKMQQPQHEREEACL